MTLHIKAVRDKGIYEKERIVLTVDSHGDIGKYILFNTTYESADTVSSSVRYTLWLPDYQVTTGDLVVIYTKKSSEIIKKKINDDNTKTIFIYWGLSKSVWNHGDDSAVLVKIDDWSSKKI